MIVIIVVTCLVILALLLKVLYGRRQEGQYVLGEQSFNASQAEERRKATGDRIESPMPRKEYQIEPGDLGLINPVQSSLDSTLVELCQRFAKTEAPERESMRTSISMNEFYTLLTFSNRAAVFALREQDVGWVVNGLTAISMIEQERTDSRDILMALSLLYHSASRIGVDANQLFGNAAALSEDAVSILILEFIKRPANEKDLRSSWGYDEVETKDGIGFIGWDSGKYDPTYDLKNIVMDIASFIATDKYQPDSVSVASDLPRVWLKSVDDAALDEALRTVRAGASVDALFRSNEDPSHASQRLMVFVVEVANESAARKLLELSQKKVRQDYNFLGITEGRLFCLVVASSFAIGVESYETAESLPRFSEGLTEILRRSVKNP